MCEVATQFLRGSLRRAIPAALTARIGDYQVNVPKVAPGTFALRIQVPRVAVPGHRVDIMVTAIRSDGASTQRAVTVFVYYF